MFFKASLYTSLLICLLGLMYRVWTWFRTNVGPEAKDFTAPQRMAAALKAFLHGLFSPRIFLIVKALVLDVLLQVRLLREDAVRWTVHMCIYAGFMLLLLMHALGDVLTAAVFRDYAPTVNPFLFLRNLFGVVVLAGVAVAIYRRRSIQKIRRLTRASDRFALILLAAIMITGFLLEAVKIASPAAFDRMVQDYSDVTEPEEVAPLKAYWAQEFGVVFPGESLATEAETMAQGRDIHESNCAACHSRPGWAFVSYPVSRLLSPAVAGLVRIRAEAWLYHLHFLACFIALAYLPFSKFMHVFSSPISLLVNGAAENGRAVSANTVSRRALALDACTHCGLCSVHCSVAPIFRKLNNGNILPSEKLLTVRTVSRHQPLNGKIVQALQEGSFVCTACGRCTRVCPAGIDLQDLWAASKSDLSERGFPEPAVWARSAGTSRAGHIFQDLTVSKRLSRKSLGLILESSLRSNSFSNCFGCSTCSNACPVVKLHSEPTKALDMTPHQIMHALDLGMVELSLSSRMIWDCLTCYTCQEHCPQGVQVCDIIYELKSLAYSHLKEIGWPETAADRPPSA